ncbi:MAG: glycosyltransferase family 2 protein [Alteromonadaceae bacterium]|nr:glycosyltransferase family 2 protein [Alteromonadaceae bacterium]
MTSCAILMTCHNRKEKTLSCLTSLFGSANSSDNDAKINTRYTITCFLVDDGSTDGTYEAVAKLFPQVKLIKGNGQLYWNQGIRLAWKTALEKQKYDYYLWLNDDVKLYKNAIVQLIQAYQQQGKMVEHIGAMVGTLQDPDSLLASYGGRIMSNQLFPLRYDEVITPTEQAVKCDFINGNCTLISAKSVEAIGILASDFSHSMGDFDYGLRLAQQGFSCWVAPDFYGQCSRNHYRKIFKSTKLPLADRILLIKKPTVLPPAKEWMVYVKRHAGVFWPVYYVKAWIRKAFPVLWVLNWK